jgi:16S rRNA processing protein RimM
VPLLRETVSALVLVGRVARAHGRKGQVIVNLETDFAEQRFAVGNQVVVELGGTAVARRIASVRFQRGRPIVGFDGVETMNEAEALAGAELKMPAAALPANTFYRHDLVGCEVQDTAGRVIGRVTGVEGPLERSLLVVGEGRNEVLIPMVEGIVVRIDAVAGRIVVELPQGLTELNSATRTSDGE